MSGICIHRHVIGNVFHRATVRNATQGIAKAFLSACLSVCLSNARIVTKGKKHLPTFLHHMKDHSLWFTDKTNSWLGRPPLPEIFG